MIIRVDLDHIYKILLLKTIYFRIMILDVRIHELL